MRNYLLFQLQGVLASWGEVVAGELRTSDNHPTRSALLGLIGAALGIERGDDARHQSLSRDLYIATLMHHTGVPLEDFHTTQTPDGNKGRELANRTEELNYKSIATILSRRTYFCDQSMTVAVWHTSDNPTFTLATIASALNAPKWTLSLGRKSCPLLTPPDARCIEAQDLKQAIEKNDFTMPLAFPSKEPRLYWDTTAPRSHIGLDAEFHATRRDDVLSRKHWTFQDRHESSARWTSQGGEKS